MNTFVYMVHVYLCWHATHVVKLMYTTDLDTYKLKLGNAVVHNSATSVHT